MRYSASILVLLLLAGCASFNPFPTDDEHNQEFRKWYANPCTRC